MPFADAENINAAPHSPNHQRPSRKKRPVLWRVLALLGLLLALWLYVLPYQSGVRLDKALSQWVADHPDWSLRRLDSHFSQRHYQLRWQPRWATMPVLLNLALFPRPLGWPSPAGTQWGWATFRLQVDPQSPIQIRQWPDQAMIATGLIETLGLVRLGLVNREAKEGRLTYDPRFDHWRGTLNLPGWQISTPTQQVLFGRTLIDIDSQQDMTVASPLASPPTSQASWQGINGDFGIDIRRIGWRSRPQHASAEPSLPSRLPNATTNGLIDHLQGRLRLMPTVSGKRQDVICSATLQALQINGQPIGGGQFALAIYSARRDFMDRLFSLWQQRLLTDSANASIHLSTQSSPSPWFNLTGLMSTKTIAPVLDALQYAEIQLDALRWQSPTGQVALSGKAFGPRFTGNTSSTESNRASGPNNSVSTSPHWQAEVQIQFSGSGTRSPLVQWFEAQRATQSTKPKPDTSRRNHSTHHQPRHKEDLHNGLNRLDLKYTAQGWISLKDEVTNAGAPTPKTAP